MVRSDWGLVRNATFDLDMKFYLIHVVILAILPYLEGHQKLKLFHCIFLYLEGHQ